MKYLKGYTITERWETLKKNNVSEVMPLINGIEELSKSPDTEKVEMVIVLEKDLKGEINQLDEDDKYVLEDMIARILYQALNSIKSDFTRWDFTLMRADDRGFGSTFEELNNLIMKSEEAMRDYSSSGDSNEAYIQKQQIFLDDINNIWDEFKQENKESMSDFYYKFFKRQLDRKREVIKRHVDQFEDNKFGEWLKSIRLQKGWSLARAAEKTGASSSYLHRIEKGTRAVPSVTKLEQIAQGYNVPQAKMITMASGNIQQIDDYIANGVFLLGDELATDEQKDHLSELMTLISENELSDAIKQLEVVIGTVHKDDN